MTPFLIAAAFFMSALGDTSATAPYPPIPVRMSHVDCPQPIARTAREAAERSTLLIDGRTLGAPHGCYFAWEDSLLVYIDAPAESILACANTMLWRFPVYQRGRVIETISVGKKDWGYRGSDHQRAEEVTGKIWKLQSELDGGLDLAELVTNVVGTYLVIHRDRVAVSVRPLDAEARAVLSPGATRRDYGWKIGKAVGIKRASRLIKTALRTKWESERRDEYGSLLGPRVKVEVVWTPVFNDCTELFLLVTNPNRFDVYVPLGTTNAIVDRRRLTGYGDGPELEFPDGYVLLAPGAKTISRLSRECDLDPGDNPIRIRSWYGGIPGKVPENCVTNVSLDFEIVVKNGTGD